MEHDFPLRNGLVLSRDIQHLPSATRELKRQVARGSLLRLRRGAYVPSDVWGAASLRERHILRARSVVEHAESPVILAGYSAAAIWGMPVFEEWPDDVTVLDRWKGGGRSEPGVRRTAAGFGTAEYANVDGFPVTSLARTALMVVRPQPLTRAVGTVDWTLGRHCPHPLTKDDLANEVRRMNLRTGTRQLEEVVRFASAHSDSFGESRARAVIHTLGFQQPELQAEFRDEEGSMFADFFWRSASVVVEFDGKVKYVRDEYSRGNPAEVVWREKKREDRLRRQVRVVVRIVTADIEEPVRLERLLLDARVPRRGIRADGGR